MPCEVCDVGVPGQAGGGQRGSLPPACTLGQLSHLPASPVTVRPWRSLPTPQSSSPLLEKLWTEATVSVTGVGTHPPGRPCTHLREQTVWTGLRNRARQLPVWKSQRRSMLWGQAWAEASSEPLPSSARAETWGQGVREGMGQQTRLPQARAAHLLCVAKEETLLPGFNVQDDDDRVARVHNSSPIRGPQGLRAGARG